jgi:Uma2 family endonuclease
MIQGMVQPKHRRATYEDVLNAPPHMVAELIGGELRLSPRPAPPHASVTSRLGWELGPPFGGGRGGPGGWMILDEPELHLDDDVVVPDLAGWRRERLPYLPQGAYFTLAPDWICEALSKSTEKTDRAEKLAIYARVGVRHAWLVSAENRTLEVMRLHDGKWLTLGVHKDDDKIRAEPFDAIELELAFLWADQPP